jgi:hypothetical protein
MQSIIRRKDFSNLLACRLLRLACSIRASFTDFMALPVALTEIILKEDPLRL